MIIDIHAHSFPEKIAASAVSHLQQASHSKAFSDGTEKGLGEKARRAGIDLSVILPVATTPRQVEHINDSSARICQNSASTGLLSFGCMHPDYPEPEKELERIRDLGIRGIKVHPVYQGTNLDDSRFLRIFRACRDLGLIVLTHAGLDIGFPGVVRCSPVMGRRVLDALPGLRLILAHMGGWRNWDEVGRYLAGTGCYIDTSFSTDRFIPLPDGYWGEDDCSMLTPEAFLALVGQIGTGKVLFGTDSPWSDQEESLDFIRRLPLSEGDRNAILGENARALLGL